MQCGLGLRKGWMDLGHVVRKDAKIQLGIFSPAIVLHEVAVCPNAICQFLCKVQGLTKLA